MQLQNTATAARLTIDLKKHRLRIPSRTFEMINDPDYFRFLVNPEAKALVIECCTENTKGAYCLKKATLNKGLYEFYSISLIAEIVQCAGFTGESTVRLMGEYIQGHDAIFFRMEQQPYG